MGAREVNLRTERERGKEGKRERGKEGKRDSRLLVVRAELRGKDRKW